MAVSEQDRSGPIAPGGARGWMRRWRRLVAWLMAGGQDGPLSERLPRAFLVFLLLFGLGMILISLVGDQGLIAYYHLGQDAAALREEVRELESRREHLTREIIALREDEAYIELLARRRLGLVKSGETVLYLPTPGSGP